MAIQQVRIQIRRGNVADYDKTKLLPGEPVLILNDKEFEICIAPGITIRAAKAEYLEEILALCQEYADVAEGSATDAGTAAQSAVTAANGAANSAAEAQEYKEFVENAVDLNIPHFWVDFETGQLMYEGGMFVFHINDNTGRLEWEVG